MKIILTIFFIIYSLVAISQHKWDRFFADCAVTGSVTIYDYNKGVWITNNPEDSDRETLPASTFKILNTLIVLNEGVVQGLDDTIQWPGNVDTTKYGYRPSIYNDISVYDAFQMSAGWAFVEMAKRVGREKYLAILDSCHYGNGIIWEEDTDFWNFGDFGVSPHNQIETLISIYEETLPFKKDTYAELKDVMIVEKNGKYVLRAKTGWTRYKGINLGWWVGYVEVNDNVFFFATRIERERGGKNSKSFSNCRKEITYTVFRYLKIIEG